MKKILLCGLMTFTINSFGEVLKIDENKILSLITEEVPRIQEIDALFQQAKAEQEGFNDKFNTSLSAGYNRIETKEKAIVSFSPVFSPVIQKNISLNKNWSYGVQTSVGWATDSRSGESPFADFNDVTTTIFSLDVSLDLWKDLFGRLTRAQNENMNLNMKKANFENAIGKKAFSLAVRRIYWALVANFEKSKITTELYKTAEKQAEDARKRLQSSVADKGEVARYESQVAARKGALLYLEFERESLLKQLSSFLPSLKKYEIELAEFDLQGTVLQVLECTRVIGAQNSTPMEFTLYDEIVSLLQQMKDNQLKIDKSYDSIDLKLAGRLKRTGVGSEATRDDLFEGSYGKSIDDMNENDRSGSEIGVVLRVPLGFSDTKTTKEILTQKRMDAQINGLISNLDVTHNQLNRSIKLLTEVIQTQRLNSAKLKIRLEDMQKKYNQARVSVSNLIMDQDALLTSDLNVIDTQIAVLNTLFDYLLVFNSTPCSFNK
jgi:hypothetical protein